MTKPKLPKAFTNPREAEVISKEYAELCAMAGDKQYRIDLLTAELRELNKKLFDLNQEHNASVALNSTVAKAAPQAEASA